MLQAAILFCQQQGYVELGTNQTNFSSSTTDVSPYNTNYKARRVQFVYTRDEIIAHGGTAGNILGMKLNVEQLSQVAYKDFTIRMGHTTATDASSHINSLFTQVYYANTFNFMVPIGWKLITFSTPFNWNGQDNIVVDICFGLNSSTSPSGVITLYGGENQMRGIASNSVTTCGTTTTVTTKGKPIVQLYMNVSQCSAPTNMTLAGIGANLATFRWTFATINPPEKYQIKVYDLSNNLIDTKEVNHPYNNLTIKLLDSNTNYKYTIQSLCPSSGNNGDLLGPYNFKTSDFVYVPYSTSIDPDAMQNGFCFENSVNYDYVWYVVTEPNGNNKISFAALNNNQTNTVLLFPKVSTNDSYRLDYKVKINWTQNKDQQKVTNLEIKPIYTPNLTEWWELDQWSYTISSNFTLDTILHHYCYYMKNYFEGYSAISVSGSNLTNLIFEIDSLSIRNLYKEAKILNFALPGQIGDAVIDSNNHTITVTFNSSTDITNLVPSVFEVSQFASVSPSPSLAQDFTNDVVYRVTAEATYPTIDWTVHANVLSTNEISEQFIKLSPNPVDNYAIINSTQDFNLTIYDATFKKISNNNITKGNNTIDVSQFADGIYLLNFSNENNNFTIKLIKK